MRRKRDRVSIATQETQPIETIEFDREMMKENPDGFSTTEGWEGFINNYDGCMHGKVPDYMFPAHIVKALEKTRAAMSTLAKNTFHTLVTTSRLHPSKLPQRGGCYGTHQLLTAYGGLNLQYREGYILKSHSLLFQHPEADEDGKMLNPATGEREERCWSPDVPQRRFTIIHHGWCWDEDRQEIVDVTEGDCGGMSDGFTIPLVWQSIGNNAKESRIAIQRRFLREWKSQKKIMKKAEKDAKRDALRKLAIETKGESGSADYKVKVPDEIFDAFMWIEPQDVAFTRNAYYKTLHDVFQSFTKEDWMKHCYNEDDAEALVSCPHSRVATIGAIVGDLWTREAHMRLSHKKEWQRRRKNWREVAEVYFPEDFAEAVAELESEAA